MVPTKDERDLRLVAQCLAKPLRLQINNQFNLSGPVLKPKPVGEGKGFPKSFQRGTAHIRGYDSLQQFPDEPAWCGMGYVDATPAVIEQIIALVNGRLRSSQFFQYLGGSNLPQR